MDCLEVLDMDYRVGVWIIGYPVRVSVMDYQVSRLWIVK